MNQVSTAAAAPPVVIIPKKSGDILKKKKKTLSPTKSDNLKLVVDDKPKSSLTDTDWTQLLSNTPINGSKDGKRLQLRSASNLLALEKKPVVFNKNARKSDVQRTATLVGVQAKDASPSFVVDGINKDLPPPVNDEKHVPEVNDEQNRLKSVKTESVSPPSDDGDTDSDSSSDSESEGEREEARKRREQLLAEKATAKAIEAIKDRENLVARLEGEKQSLEKIIDERAKQQANEVFFCFLRISYVFLLFMIYTLLTSIYCCNRNKFGF